MSTSYLINKAKASSIVTAVLKTLALCCVILSAGLGAVWSQSEGTEQILQETRPVLETGRFYRIGIPGDVSWTDTRFDVKAGQTITFSAQGGISLQQGNPRGYCGPDGLGFSTVQQPVPERNFGALIGKVVLLISIDVDEETGEETRNEIEEFFYIGSEQSVEMPINGNLYLGINELVTDDNSGALSVQFELEEKSLQSGQRRRRN